MITHRHATLAFAFALALLPAGLAEAHHGWSSYDANTVLRFEAPIQEVSYQSPHGLLVVEHDGKRWEVVLAPPSRMQARGLPREDLTVGKTVIIEGYPSRRDEGELRAERITVDGRTVELR
ncbi:DUF6152 family protein [Rhodoligotrophos defluvii]|uniref:DUF6152 family protein n=1 Tax=Rhodoligotrophos defluvii TaxID=2561934 RepID=UPI00148574E9|nr:DUF6152 family protein [Rhodoligotrophos defluvii]